MAITHNKPIQLWYFDETSQWTLDYPPLFALFEWLLAFVANLLNLQDALQLSESSIRTESIIIYQKLTVILSDSLYYYGVYKLSKSLQESTILRNKTTNDDNNKSKTDGNDSPAISNDKVVPKLAEQEQNLLDAIYRPNKTSCIALMLLLQPGLLLVDHIHFQYNGFLSGILLLSMASIISGHQVMGSIWFAILLNFKHIYVYCAPAFGMYLLTSYCLCRTGNQNLIITFLKRIVQLGVVVTAVFCLTYLPFSNLETLRQILSRLFPFKRGLTHAYWAPNIWALYNTADKVLATVFRGNRVVKFDLESISNIKPITSSSGLVQEYDHQYLPTIRPLTTFILVAIFTLPLVIKFLLKSGKPSAQLFIKGVTLASFTSFMFGWHVHEKAIITVLLPMAPLCFLDSDLKRTFLRLTLAGTYSLFPLLFQPEEYLTKLTILLAYYFYARSLSTSDKKIKASSGTLWNKLYNSLDTLFVFAILLVEIYATLIHGRFNWNPLNKYDFLPLMLTSSSSALGITWSYLDLYWAYLVAP